jgi:NAD(P)-dependent dehydrogenase (short-subunit alcohol dehydrogenase family)
MDKILIFGESDIGLAVQDLYPNSKMIAKEVCDIRDENSIKKIIEEYKPTAVINCAGVSNLQKVLNSDAKKWQEEIEVNLIGSYLLAREILSFDKKIPMIFLASVAGMYGKPDHSGYSASKSGVISLVQSLAMEGYRAYAISPGRVNTKMREKDFPGEDIKTRLSTSEVAAVIKKCLDGHYSPGDNVVIRKRGYRKLNRIDKGQPWKQYLNVQIINS